MKRDEVGKKMYFGQGLHTHKNKTKNKIRHSILIGDICTLSYYSIMILYYQAFVLHYNLD